MIVSVPSERISLEQLTASQLSQIQTRIPPDYPLTQYIEDVSQLHIEIDSLIEVGSDFLEKEDYSGASAAFVDAAHLHDIYQTLSEGNLSHALNIIEKADPVIGYYLPQHLHRQLYESR